MESNARGDEKGSTARIVEGSQPDGVPTERFVGTAEQGVVEVDSTLRCRRWSPALARFSQLPARLTIGRPLKDTLPPPAVNLALALQAALDGATSTSGEFCFSAAPNATQFEAWAWPVIDQQQRTCGALAIVRPRTPITAQAQAIASPAEHVPADESRQLDFHRLITDISAEFANLPGHELNPAINRALATIGRFAQVDRSYVFLYRSGKDEPIVDNTHEWCEAGIDPQINNLQGVVLSRDFPWFADKIHRGPIYIPRVDKLPPSAHVDQKNFELQSIQSLIVVPVSTQGRLIGFLGFDSVRKTTEWTNETIALLTVVGEAIANALLRCEHEERLRSSEERLEHVIDGSIIGVLFWHDNKIENANDAFLNMVGYSRADLEAGRLAWPEMTPPEFSHLDQHGLIELQTTGVCTPFEKAYIRKDGSQVPVLVGFECLHGDPTRGVGFVLDITERKKAEEALRMSEEKFRILGRNVPGVVYLCQNDERYTMLHLNDAAGELTGLPVEKLRNNEVSFVELYHPDDEARIYQEVDAALSTRQPFKLTYRLRHARGDYRWVEELGQGIFDDGELKYLVGSIFDITERKERQQELERLVEERTAKLIEEQRLLKELLDQHENDRKLISYEIHDGMAQYTTAALLHLETFLKSQTKDLENFSKFELGLLFVRRTLDEARRLISDLRPPILEEAGVVEAVRYLASEFPDPQVAVQVEVEGEIGRMPSPIEGAAYRIVQEALNNAAKHSQTSHIEIKLARREHDLLITVRDHGRGFDLQEQASRRAKTRGLEGIRLRTEMLGGEACFHSALGEGTTVSARLPLPDSPPAEEVPAK